jgi:type II secretory pathway component PulF
VFGSTPREIGGNYHSMRTMIQSGVPVVESLQVLLETAPRAQKSTFRNVIALIKRGNYLHEALKLNGVAPMDCAFVKTGEMTGSLSAVCDLLSDHYQERSQFELFMKAALTKPLIMLTVLLFTSAIPPYFAGLMSTTALFMRTIGALTFIFGALFGLQYLFRNAHRYPEFTEKIRRTLRSVPLVQKFFELSDGFQFFSCYYLCVRSGLDLTESVKTLTLVVPPESKFRQALYRMRVDAPKVGLTEALSRADALSPGQLQGIRVGEESGSLELQLQYISKGLAADRDRYMQTVAEWLPRILYGITVAIVVYNIIGPLMNSMAAPTIPE